jgi:hypothetical protein
MRSQRRAWIIPRMMQTTHVTAKTIAPSSKGGSKVRAVQLAMRSLSIRLAARRSIWTKSWSGLSLHLWINKESGNPELEKRESLASRLQKIVARFLGDVYHEGNMNEFVSKRPPSRLACLLPLIPIFEVLHLWNSSGTHHIRSKHQDRI